MEKKQSSIDWLVDQIEKDANVKLRGLNLNNLLEKAKAMHKDEIEEAYRISPNNEIWSNSGIDYYNETFGGEEC